MSSKKVTILKITQNAAITPQSWPHNNDVMQCHRHNTVRHCQMSFAKSMTLMSSCSCQFMTDITCSSVLHDCHSLVKKTKHMTSCKLTMTLHDVTPFLMNEKKSLTCQKKGQTMVCDFGNLLRFGSVSTHKIARFAARYTFWRQKGLAKVPNYTRTM